MNERIKELAEQAGLNWRFSPAYEECLEHFAELVRDDEREACAKLCDDMGNKQTNQCLYDPWDCASSIRARGNHEQD